ncbi:hypothetical protein EDB81DRAFT_861053 [Dactylonectria macrodidyma]|uniref:ATP-dependent DNA ligase family profile domain-containing protein n=1 Tax=Dactylonectria macrodidyma TaxID=307937 RepID=A0A9P9IJE5_9HYPO|nr:hypothetical protein EDB81DRAFT_861053 [Dactylonectria macrodidyma]
MGIHRALRNCLELDTAGCKIKKRCILEGELLVWNDDGRIEPFHKIRRHVKRAGRFLGAAQDSPVESSEHLMIMFYDILLLDDTVCGLETHDERRRRLQSLVRRIPGRTDIGSREVIDFSSFDAAECLSETFAQAITQRWEGCVLKGCDDPYFSFNGSRPFIKLKKDYIPGLGDTADFVIIGGRRDAGDEHELGIGSLWWTSFYIGCIENKDEVCRFNAKPRFHIIDTIASLRARRRRPNLSEFAGSVDVVGRSAGQGHQLDQMRTSTKAGRYGDTDSTTSLTPRTQGDSSDFKTCA